MNSASHYLLEISEEADFANAQFRSLEENAAEITRSEPGLLHYRVAGENAGGEGPWSNVVTSLITPPAPDWIEVSEAEAGGYTISWGSREDVLPTGLRASVPMVVRKKCSRGRAITVRMRTRQRKSRWSTRCGLSCPGVASAWVESAPVKRSGPKLASPQMEAPQNEEGGLLLLRWNPVAGADSYTLEVSSNRDFTGSTRSTESAAARGRFIPRAAGLYFFRVYAVSEGEKPVTSPPSNVVACEVKRPAGPALWPVNPVEVGEEFAITWRGVPNCTTYVLEEARDMAFTQVTNTWRVAHPRQEFSHPAAEAGRLYFRARALYENDDESEWSRVIPVDVG